MTGGRIVALRPRASISDHAATYPVWTPMHPDFDPAAAPDAYEESQLELWYAQNRGGD